MNPILEDKFEELNQLGDYECWYVVKQPTAFDSICYLVSFLKEFKEKGGYENLKDFISLKVSQLISGKPDLNISDNYRALRVAAFFGLILMTSSKYDDAMITETFHEIESRCNGAFEKTKLYEDIIQRQIEKMFISSSIDEAGDGVRKDYRLYPVMLLYKVLLEEGRATRNYAISITEYRYLVATTKKFEDFLDTLLLIKLLRNEDESVPAQFEIYRAKFDNRMIQALKQLNTLTVDKDSIRINPDKLDEVAHKVYLFESNPNRFATEDYLTFLGSTKSLFQLGGYETEEKSKKEEKVGIDESKRVPYGTNILLYGVPGSGKSWTIEHEYCRPETKVERIVFHPDYTNADFIGQILPRVNEEKQVTYGFAEGPFTKILRDAYQNPATEYVLIIEEINRGNAPAIFGDIFQLLDRTTQAKTEQSITYPAGTSEYGVTNEDIAAFVYGDSAHKVRIPSNLSLLGTMNTSDQNVFTLDTAFQRRWRMRLIENNFDHVRLSLSDAPILDTDVTWKRFCTVINKMIVGNKSKIASAEDKRLGVYFVHESDLVFNRNAESHSTEGLFHEYTDLLIAERDQAIDEVGKLRLSEIRTALIQNRIFPEKVIKYLWDDAFKFTPEAVFDTEQFDCLEDIIHTFVFSEKNDRFRIFRQTVRDHLLT